MGCGGSERWRNRGRTCGAMLCCAVPTGPCSRRWGCGDVFCRFLAAAWMELPGNCRVEAKREQSRSCRDPRFSISTPTPGQWGPAKAMRSLVPCLLPPSLPGVATGLCFCRGMDPGEGHWHLLACPEGARWGWRHWAWAGWVLSTPRERGRRISPRQAPHLALPCPGTCLGTCPGTPGPVPAWQAAERGGLAATPTCPPCPRGNPAPGVPGWGVSHPPPTFSHAAAGAESWAGGPGMGQPTSGDVSPVQGTLGRGSIEGGAVPCAPGLAWGNCVGVRGVCRGREAAGGRGAVGLCPLFAVCDRL